MTGLIFVFMFVGAVIASHVASSKHRNVIGWMFAGALFPLISVVAILCLPAVEPTEVSTPS